MAEHRIFKNFLRGTGGIKPGKAVAEQFEDPDRVAAATALQMSDYDDNPEGKIFLGLIDATIKTDKPLPDGRANIYATAGRRIGVGDDRHVITVAGSRAGKGRAVLVPNLITYSGSVLVVDPKGDLARCTADRRKAMGQDVYVFDPFGAAGEVAQKYEAAFNPLAMLEGSRELQADAGLIADALVIPVPGTKDPHWDDSARQLIEGLVLHVVTSGNYIGRRNLVTVYELLWTLLEPAKVKGKDGKVEIIPGLYPLEVDMRANDQANGAVKHAAADFYDRADRERDSVLSSARRHLHFLGYPEIQKTLKGESIDLRDLKRKRVTIFLSLKAMRMSSCARWLRLFINLSLAAFEMEQIAPKVPVLMCLDEFAVLGTMKTLEDAIGQIAGLGCKIWAVLQDLSQLKALYADRWETFMGNAGVLQFFGNSELTTLEWIAKRLGTTGIINQSQSNVAYQQAASGATGQAWAAATAELMSGAEIARFFGRDDELLRQLIIRPTEAPMVLQRAFYDKLPFFQGKYKPPLPPPSIERGR